MSKSPAAVAATVSFLIPAVPALAQSSTDLFDVSQTTITVTAHTPVLGGTNDNSPSGDAIYNLFGATNAAVEGNDRIIFQDADPQTVDFTRGGTAPVNTVTVYVTSDGGTEGASRGASAFNFLADLNNNGFAETVLVGGVNPADSGASTYAFPAQTATRFRAEFARNPGGAGTRVFELDGTFDANAVAPNRFIDRELFNAVTNTAPTDEPAGRVTNILASSAVGNDTPQDAFGNNDGTIEPQTFIFADGGAADNGDDVLGNGGETVYSLAFDTTSPVTLAGVELILGGGEGGPAGNRGAQRYEFLGDGALLAAGDANGTEIGALTFASPVTADSFELRLTGTVSGGSSGPRIFEINAIVPVPEPTTGLTLLSLAGLALTRPRRRAG